MIDREQFQIGLTKDLQLPEPEEKIRSELGSGERLLWAGRPPQGIKLRSSDALMIPFSLMWGGFAIFWEAFAFLIGAPLFFKLFGLPFVAIGIYIMIGRFFFDAYARANTFYGVTEDRIIIISGKRKTTVKSLKIQTLSEISLTESGGAGIITFGPTRFFMGSFPGRGWPGRESYASPSFELPAEARTVYEIIRAAQEKRRPASTDSINPSIQ